MGLRVTKASMGGVFIETSEDTDVVKVQQSQVGTSSEGVSVSPVYLSEDVVEKILAIYNEAANV
jgi:hypothetical protein